SSPAFRRSSPTGGEGEAATSETQAVGKSEHKPRQKHGDNFGPGFSARWPVSRPVLVDMWNRLPTGWGLWGQAALDARTAGVGTRLRPVHGGTNRARDPCAHYPQGQQNTESY